MKIIIHRGLDQIGGCITEISTASSRIFIDMGQNLPGVGDKPDPVRDRAMVEHLFSRNVKPNQAVVYSHAHADHVGLFEYVPHDIPQFIGEGAKKVLTLKYDAIKKGKEYQLSRLDDTPENSERRAQLTHSIEEDASRYALITQFGTWKRPSLESGSFVASLMALWRKNKKSSFHVGDIKITPFPTCHSIYDSYMFLIEAEGKRVWHMGDYRQHGYQGPQMMDTLNANAKDVDVLITEGTMLLHDEDCIDENTVSQQMQKVMLENKYVFVLASSTDMERLAAIKEAAKGAGKNLYVCSGSMRRMMGLFNNREGGKSKGLFTFHPVCYDEAQHLDTMKKDGFAMIVGVSNLKKVLDVASKVGAQEVMLVYSAWDGYYKDPAQVELNPSYKVFRESFSRVVDIHTSGHADRRTIASVISMVNPSLAVIGIHKDANASLESLPLDEEIKRKIVNSPELEL